MKLLFYALCALLSPLITLAAQLANRACMGPQRRARTFLPATWGVALLYAPLVSMIPWVWVTRQEWPTWRRRGLAYACSLCLLVLAAGVLATLFLWMCFNLAVRGCGRILGVAVD